jgi:hypothetical protein
MTQQRRWLAVGLLLAAGALGGCRKQEAPAPVSQLDSVSAGSDAKAAAASPLEQKPPGTSRKIIRQAELELEVAAPGTTQTSIERLAEQRGGYVVSATRTTENASAVDMRVTVTVRVPQAELMNTIAELKHFGRGVGSERITSDDVTDEYLDLAARSASQRQLELQYLEILKRAATVKDAMEVQKQLAEVRTEIERMQGRQQLLEKESAFSTLTVHLTTAVPRVAAAGPNFSGTFRRAWSDALSLSVALISGAIRLVGFLLPLLLLIGLPGTLLVWGVGRVGRRRRAAMNSQ